MSIVNLSLLKSVDLGGESELIFEVPKFIGSIADSLEDRIFYYEMFLRNNGNEDELDPVAYDLGFYITSPDDSSNFEECLRWGSLDPDVDDRAYGLFTVFGLNVDNESYIEKFKENTITPEDLSLFHHHWTQGTGPVNKIKLSVAKIPTLSGLQYADNLDVADGGSATVDGSKRGSIKVLVGIRMPATVSPIRFRFRHCIFFEEAA